MAGVPSVTYAVLAAYDVHARWPFVVCLAAAFGGAMVFLAWVRKTATVVCSFPGSLGLAVGAWAIQAAWPGSFDEGLTALLGSGIRSAGDFDLPELLAAFAGHPDGRGRVFLLGRGISRGHAPGPLRAFVECPARTVEYAEDVCRFRHDPGYC